MLMTNQLATLEHLKTKAIDVGLEFGPKVAAALVMLVVAFFVSRWIAGLIERWIAKLDLEPPVRQLILRVVRAVVFLLFGVMAIQQLGFALGPIVAGLGVAGAGIALAMQGVLGNLAAGLTIIFTKPFKVGEYVAMVGVEGRVESINLFTTKLSHPDLSTVVVPNRKIVGEILHDYGKIRQLNIIVGVAYDTDLNLAVAAVQRILSQNPRVLKNPEAAVRVVLLADSSIQIAITPWVNVADYGPAIGEINYALVEEFRQKNISIPFPQREVRLLNPAA